MDSTVQDSLKKKQIIDEIDALNQLAYNIRSTHAEKSSNLATRNHQIAEKYHYSEGMAFSLHIIGLINLDKGACKEAVEKTKEALEIFSSLSDEEGMSSTLNTLGITLRNIGSYERALDCLMKSLKIQLNMNNTANIASLYCNIGNTCGNLERYSEGLQYHLKCLEIVEEMNDEEGIADAYSNLGICYMHLDQNRKSLESHQKALKIRKSMHDEKGMSFCLNNLGMVFERTGKHEKALECYHASLDIKLKFRMKLETARACNTIGNLHRMMSDFMTAEQYLEKGAKLSREVNSSTAISENHRYLSFLYSDREKYKYALKHHMEFHRLDKEIFNSQRIAGMEAQLDLMNSELHTTNRKLEQANVRLNRLSITDGLTGIYNRRRFEEFLTAEWNRCKRKGIPVSLIMIDIDFFKHYNDSYGHTMGDDCLKAIAQALSMKAHRPTDLTARYGGEEFAIVLSETEQAGAMSVSESAKASVEAMQIPHESSDASDVVTISLGLSTMIPGRDEGQAELIQRADRALYISKEMGRNRITVFEDHFKD